MKVCLSLRWLITVIVVVSSIVPCIILGFILTSIASHFQEVDIKTSSEVIAKAVNYHLVHVLEHSTNTVQIIQDSMESGALFMEVVPYLSKSTKFRAITKSVRLLDQWKRIQVVYPLDMNQLGMDLSGLPFLKGLKEGDWAISEVYLDLFSREPIVSVCKGIKNGYLCLDLNLEFLKQYMDFILETGPFRVVVVDRNGLPIYHPERRTVFERQSLAHLLNKAFDRQGVIRTEIGHLGERYIGTLFTLPGAEWHVFVGQPEKVAFESMNEAKKIMYSLVAVVTCLAVLMGLFLRNLIIRPMKGLKEIAEKVSKGDYELPQTEKGYKEILELIGAFKIMADRVREREENIIKSQRRYKDLLENAVDPIIITDEKGNILEVNRALLQRGYKQEEFIGDSVAELLGPKGPQFELILKELHEKGVYNFELEKMKKQGGLAYYSVSTRYVGEVGKEGAMIQFTFRDITELRDAYERVRQSEERYKDIYDSVRDLIYTQDLEGRILSANKSLIRIFGYEEEEFVGRKVSDFIKPEYREAFETEYLAKLKEEGFYEGISQYYRKDGKKIYLEYKSVLVTDKEGNKYISGIGRDITEQFLAQKRLREEEKRVRTILETVNVPIALYNLKGEILFINQAFTNTFGWTKEEAIGKVLPEIPESEKERNRQALKRFLKTRVVELFETKRYTKSGEELNVIINAGIVKDPLTGSDATVIAYHDITEFRRIEKALATAQRMEALGILAGGIAHNFNNILMGITGNVQLLRMRLGRDHPEIKRLETIEKLIGDATTLTRQLVHFARGGKYEPRPTDLNVLIKEHNKIFGTTRKEVLIQEDLQEGLWTVECDRNQFKQVLMNLYINSVQAIEERLSMQNLPQAGGIITVKTQNVVLEKGQLGKFQKEDGAFVRVSISDNGKGMDEETKRRIFDPFFTTKEVGKGTGLGLASVYGIIKNHEGFIDVESKLGQGTTFHIYLPALKSERPIGEQPEKEEPIVRGRGKILLVDDEKLVLDSAKEMLEELGYEVLATDNPNEALQVYQRQKENIDLVILDMVMPGKDGAEALREIRVINPKAKVVLASGYGVEPYTEELKSMGCAGVIQKPYKISELSQVVHEVLKT